MLNIKDFISYVGVSDIELATSALLQAEGFVSTILGNIVESEKTEVYDGNGETTLILKRTPVVSVSSMSFSGSIVDPTTYFQNTYGIRMYCPFPRGFGVISVTYTAGWTNDTIPSDLKYAIYDIARAYMKAGDSLGSNVKRESIDGASVEWGELPISGQISVINSYKSIHV